jgi:5'-nucleotidase
MKHILVTNDDGIYGPGLAALVKELGKIAKVTVVVPDQERSGTSHSITLHKPLRIQKINAQTYIVNGTPTDCVRFGALSLMKRKVDLVVSGINAGPNMGHDVIYSGTVAGAREGALLKIPSFAISVVELLKPDFKLAARTALKIANNIFKKGLPDDIYLNVNVPNKARGIEITSLGHRIYDEEIDCRIDPRGRKYYWLAGKFVSGVHQKGTDITVVEGSCVSITPLQLDPTATQLFGEFITWKENLS